MNPPQFVVEETTDPVERAGLRHGAEQYRLNSDWLQAHWADLLPAAEGRYVAVAGRQAFVGESAAEALDQAKAAHPDDAGMLVEYVRPTTGPRVYGSSLRWPPESPSQRNLNWLQAHWPELGPRAEGRFLAVAGRRAYLAESSQEAITQAQAAHPEDAGIILIHPVISGLGTADHGNRR
jgi:hypothetical protein